MSAHNRETEHTCEAYFVYTDII